MEVGGHFEKAFRKSIHTLISISKHIVRLLDCRVLWQQTFCAHHGLLPWDASVPASCHHPWAGSSHCR
jgi:hypothetical protein